MGIVSFLRNKQLDEAKAAITNRMAQLASLKLEEAKKMLVAREHNGEIDEELLDEARIAIIKARIRNGKVQRRKKVSNVAGFTLRNGRLKRMSPTERRNRRLGQRRGKIKRRAKKNIMLRKRKRSLMRRKSMGLK